MNFKKYIHYEKYETKLEKLTCLRITIVLMCEILFEFSFGIIFFIYTRDHSQYSKKCTGLLFWTDMLWMLYLAEFSIAFICFLIGIMSQFCYRELLTKVYIGFNNFFKGIIIIASIIFLAIITIEYNKTEDCGILQKLTFLWMLFQYSLLAVACFAVFVIGIVTMFIYCKTVKPLEAEDTIQEGLVNKNMLPV